MSEFRPLNESGGSHIEIIGNEAVHYIHMNFSHVFTDVPTVS